MIYIRYNPYSVLTYPISYLCIIQALSRHGPLIAFESLNHPNPGAYLIDILRIYPLAWVRAHRLLLHVRTYGLSSFTRAG